MQTNELRIGNWIKNNYDTGNSLSRIEQVDIDLLIDISDFHELADKFKPVTLTPEILEKCGFEKNLTDDKDIYFTLKFSENKFTDLCFISGKGGAEVNLFPYDGKDFKYHYLHQLQNLYFALTGEELNINL